MLQVEKLKTHLKRGQVYRREDLAQWSKSVDRHLEELTEDGTLEKLYQGLYYYPRLSVYGKVPPDADTLIKSFLKDNRFLIMSANYYNGLGVGTTQLYNNLVVYNHKRHGTFKFGNNVFEFRCKPHFPSKLTEEFLLVDLADNLETLAEDKNEVRRRMMVKISNMELTRLKNTVSNYGSAGAKKLFKSALNKKLAHA